MKSLIVSVIKTFRLPFLLLAIVSVFLGMAAASVSQSQTNWLHFGWVLLAAVFAHISVNTFNEYLDFKSGLDAQTVKTPFSGGSGALPENPAAAKSVLLVALTSLLLTVCIGLYFVLTSSVAWQLLSIGALGIAIIISYTHWLNRQAWLCLIAPGFAFGPLIIIGTSLVLTSGVSQPLLLASLVSFCLTNNLLLLNQLPDIDADKQVGRRHFPIVYGISNSLFAYCIFVLATLLTIAYGISQSMFPFWSLAALLPLLLTIVIVQRVRKYTGDIKQLTPCLGMNVAVALTVPLILGISLL